MQIERIDDPERVAQRGAALITETARAAIKERGRFLIAASGGTNPWLMYQALAKENLPWDKVHVFQVDERVAPDDDPDRNFKHLRESLIDRVPLPSGNVHPMPVTEPDLAAAAGKYARTLQEVAGSAKPVLDLVHLGLGPDGHTASLVPGDPVLKVTDRDVAITGPYQKRQRMTLTYPMLNRAAKILWLVTGGSKADPVVRMHAGDSSVPAGGIERDRAILLADSPALAKLQPSK